MINDKIERTGFSDAFVALSQTKTFCKLNFHFSYLTFEEKRLGFDVNMMINFRKLI